MTSKTCFRALLAPGFGGCAAPPEPQSGVRGEWPQMTRRESLQDLPPHLTHYSLARHAPACAMAPRA
eukprot:2798821-Pyramimonas_sp.AAC.1